MKNIIVFGGSGNIGKYFIKYFKECTKNNNYEIIAVGRRKTNFFDRNNIKYFNVDITKKEDFDLLPQNVYAVVDLAGAMPARMKGYKPDKYIDVNIIGTLNILEYCRKNNVNRILFSQSFGDIKDWAEKDILLKVDMSRNFKFNSDHTVYVMTKNFAVDLLENYKQMYGLKIFVFRLPTIYLFSPIDTYYVDGIKRKYGWRILIDNAIAGNDIEVWGDPYRSKDMVYVKDLCQMLYKALWVKRDSGYYNVGTGVGTPLIEQIKTIVKVFSNPLRQPSLIMRPDKPNAPQYIMDIESAVKELGYQPKYNFEDAMKDFKLEMEKYYLEKE